MPPTPAESWAFLPIGFLITVAIEAPILLVGLSSDHPIRDRLIAGVWLTACTYPIVVLVLPQLFWVPMGRPVYLLVAETFAPAAECGLFWLAYGRGMSRPPIRIVRDFSVIVAANLASFLFGELLWKLFWT